MPFNANAAIAEIDGVLKKFDDVLKQYGQPVQGYPHRQVISAPADVRSKLVTLLCETTKRLAPTPNYGNTKVERYIQDDVILVYVGKLRALRDDYANGRILTLQERIRSDVFSNFLEMAEYLIQDEGLKDPAAVVAGSVIEEHLRKLCDKHGIDTTFKDGNGDVRPKKLDTMNADLVKANAYGKNEGKQVTAWAGLRNDAAHGKYSSYSPEQVKLMIAGIRDFLTRYPA